MGPQDDSPVRRTTGFHRRLFSQVGAMIVVAVAAGSLALFSPYRTALREKQLHLEYPVVKIDLAEVGAPLVRTGGVVVGVALVLTVLVAGIVHRNGESFPRRVERDEARFRGLTEVSPDHILLLDRDLRVEFLNHPAPGLTLEDILGNSILDLLPDEEKGRVTKTLQAVLDTGESDFYETFFQGPEGEGIHYETHVGPSRTEGEITGLILNSRDTTERKRAEEERDWRARLHSGLAAMAAVLVDPDSTLEKAAQVTLMSAVGLTRSDHGFVSSIDPVTGSNVGNTLSPMIEDACVIDGEVQSIDLARGDDGRYAGPCGHALNTGIPFYTNEPASHEASSGVPSGHIPLESFLSVPAMVGETPLGQIAVANSPGGYSDRDLEAVGRLADLYAAALAQRRSRDLLQESEERFRDLFERAPVPYQSLDMNGRFLEVNGAWLNHFGFQREEIIGRWFEEVLTPESGKLFTKRFSLFKAAGETRNAEFYMVRRDGSQRLASITGRIGHSGAGEFARTHCIVTDITERRGAEEALRESEARYRTIVETANEGVWLIDAEGLTQYANDQMARMLGYTCDGLVGRSILGFMSKPQKTRALDLLGRMLEGARGQHELTFLRKDGSELHALVSTGPILGPAGAPSGALALVTDISEIKRLQRQVLEVSERERQNAGEMLHDTVGQEVSGIAMLASALAQDLRRKGETAQAHEAARVGEMAEEAALRVRELARGLFPVHLREFGIDASLEALAGDLTARESVECIYTLEAGDPEFADEEAIQLYRICQEACRNAVRHASASSISITLRAMDGELALSVEDDGSGLPPEKKRGIGMGLSMMRHRASTIGASTEVDRGESRGTRVTCRMETTAGGGTHV